MNTAGVRGSISAASNRVTEGEGGSKEEDDDDDDDDDDDEGVVEVNDINCRTSAPVMSHRRAGLMRGIRNTAKSVGPKASVPSVWLNKCIRGKKTRFQIIVVYK